MVKPLVSVIIPVYNAELYLFQALESITTQTLRAIEIIIINDGSTDSSAEIIDSFAKHDSRIIVISQVNLGLSQSLNKGIEIASSEFVARMDADDIAKKDRLKSQLKLISGSTDIVLVSSNVDYIGESGEPLGLSHTPTWERSVHNAISKGNIIFHPSVMMRKKAVIAAGLYSESVKHYIEDYLLWLKMRELGRFIITKKSYIFYRVVSNSVSREVSDDFKDTLLSKYGVSVQRKRSAIFRLIAYSAKVFFGKSGMIFLNNLRFFF